jgi:large subunit ribosomal protein L9
MDILLLEDVYNLGRAGEIKKVAKGFGRNFLIPQGLAVPASTAALQQAERITEEANQRREVLNSEMAAVAEQIAGIQLLFPARAGETGKLYGSITTQAIADQINEKLGMEIDKRQIDSQPLRLLGMHAVAIRLTIDLIPEFSVVVYREGESPDNYMIAAEDLAAESAPEAEEVEEEVPAPDLGQDKVESDEAPSMDAEAAEAG